MYDPLGLSIGTTNLVAVRSGTPPVSRRAVLTLFPDRAPELGLPEKDSENADAADTGTLMAGFVERVGGSHVLKSADGSTHDPALLLVEALDVLTSATGGKASTSNITMAVPAHWGQKAMRGLQDALSTHADFVHGGIAPRLVADSVAALTALNADSRLPSKGVVALLDFGGSGTSITLADAASGFTPIANTLRFSEFSGDLVDQALMVHALDSAGHSSGADPASTAVVGQFAGLRDECRLAKERLSTEKATDLVIDLPGKRTSLALSRAELDSLIEERLDDLLAAFDDLLRRNRVRRGDLAAVAMAGGGAKIPVVAQRLSSHTKASVVTAVQPAFATAVGAVMLSATRPIEQKAGEREETTMAALVGASTGSFATSTSGLATTGRFLAPTDALGTPTGTFGMPTAGALFDDPSERLTELAWSQADDSGEEPVLYTGEPYDTDDNRATPSQLMQLPKAEPFDMAPRGTRLPQLFLGLAALVSMIAIGGVAFTLTSSSNRAPTLPSSTTTAPPLAATELAASVAEPGTATPAERGAVADRRPAADQRGASAASASGSDRDVRAPAPATPAARDDEGAGDNDRAAADDHHAAGDQQHHAEYDAPAATTTAAAKHLHGPGDDDDISEPAVRAGADTGPGARRSGRDESAAAKPVSAAEPLPAEPLPAESVPAEPVYAAEPLLEPGVRLLGVARAG